MKVRGPTWALLGQIKVLAQTKSSIRREKLFFCLPSFKTLPAFCIPWFVAPSSILKVSKGASSHLCVSALFLFLHLLLSSHLILFLSLTSAPIVISPMILTLWPPTCKDPSGCLQPIQIIQEIVSITRFLIELYT